MTPCGPPSCLIRIGECESRSPQPGSSFSPSTPSVPSWSASGCALARPIAAPSGMNPTMVTTAMPISKTLRRLHSMSGTLKSDSCSGSSTAWDDYPAFLFDHLKARWLPPTVTGAGRPAITSGLASLRPNTLAAPSLAPPPDPPSALSPDRPSPSHLGSNTPAAAATTKTKTS